MEQKIIFILMGCCFFAFIGLIVYFGNNYNLNNIKSKTVGDGQHGTARFATQQEINKTFHKVVFNPEKWRKGIHLPTVQGIIVGSKVTGGSIQGYVDSDDVHLLMIGAAGVGKTAHFLYPNLEYACATGVSFITTDTKGGARRSYMKSVRTSQI